MTWYVWCKHGEGKTASYGVAPSLEAIMPEGCVPMPGSDLREIVRANRGQVFTAYQEGETWVEGAVVTLRKFDDPEEFFMQTEQNGVREDNLGELAVCKYSYDRTQVLRS